ncbi:MAG: cyclic nucleotide-binding domain-containing protein [Planctomycetota bacterium]
MARGPARRPWHGDGRGRARLMEAALARCPLFAGLDTDLLARLMDVAETERCDAGCHPFVLGQAAEHVYVVMEGRVDLCLPLTIEGELQEVCIDTKEPGDALGWSAFVRPYRFRLSARAAGMARLVTFPRRALEEIFRKDPRAGHVFLGRVA